ncbi:DUF559 domain-containing protein [Klenkia taihuensis]|uniref:Transcriptional regulator, AbiEi antitoxin, Type IV TA system n=1 Tax=Klenkia taihuensis TaxID=1225127 RepID=A0A1I1MVQ8_9ACTN|nr:DUF559 domain-containing protein [Klenkia taihuensis]GHE12443.1 hypothetical protein GCM10011381_30310 [Klenkia taihuensis]SFC89544.1 Transcriptional regulator, AbiEi antitoxin, Type IV TA system [Klenkia taihuensis]
MSGKKELLAALAAHGGIATRQELLQAVPARTVDAGTRLRWVTRLHPHTYVATATTVTDELRARAALRYAMRDAALSHLTALALHRGEPLGGTVHLTVDHGRRLAGGPRLVVHRRTGFVAAPPMCRTVRGLLLTEPARTAVDSWPLLPLRDRRPAVIDLVRRGTVSGQELDAALRQRANVAGHVELRRTIALVLDGVRSELEALGVLGVFAHPELPPSQGQRRVDLPGRRCYLDRCWPEAGLVVELDGAAHHTSPEDRRRDLERDRLLSAAGWLVLRFTYADVVRDPAAVRAQVLAVYRARVGRCAV